MLSLNNLRKCHAPLRLRLYSMTSMAKNKQSERLSLRQPANITYFSLGHQVPVDVHLVELSKLGRKAEIFVTHLKPGQVERIMDEIRAQGADFSPGMLQNDQVFEF